MAIRDRILAWMSIIIGGAALLGFGAAGVVFYVDYAVAQSFVDAKPASVAAVEMDIKLIQNDMAHIVTDVAENKAIAQDTNTIFREYLEEQAR